jgi:CheY-like chemotaxis protein
MSKRILVVEDQPDNRQIIRDMLAPTDYEITGVPVDLKYARIG